MEQIFKGICPHVEESAYKDGFGYNLFLEKELGKPPYSSEQVSKLHSIANNWNRLVIEKYGRLVIRMGIEDYYAENYCKECLLELVRDIELYEKTFDSSQ